MNRKLLSLLLFVSLSSFAQITPKREFRGVWISIIYQEQYPKMSVPEMKQYFTAMLDSLQACNMNAILFQVRPSADAVYASNIEPWSKHLTGQQGRAPQDNFDLMAFLIEAAHDRHIEFHAWINPYRVTSSANEQLHPGHIYFKHPEWFVTYGGKIYFDPGLPESKKYICQVVHDIVSRYDVDAIHTDDYFYPYPIAGEQFPDDNSFRKYAQIQGFSSNQRADWRRNNVNDLIREIKNTIVLTKPWVRFGVSPFGIYRNKKNTPDGSGSATNGLQNYDDLYADVKYWVEQGWIDYNIPQIYWEIGNKAADYDELIHWWARNNYGKHLYIGQDVDRTMKAGDFSQKMQLERSLPGVYGNCWWPVYEVTKNNGGIKNALQQNQQRYPALIPAYTHQHHRAPKDVKALKAEWTVNGYTLTWKRNGDSSNPEKAQYYVVYRFGKKEKTNLNDPAKIVTITRNTSCQLPYQSGKEKYKYVVTSVDRFHNETKKGKSKTVKL